jgi:hexulose-6-phosphate isomerase
MSDALDRRDFLKTIGALAAAAVAGAGAPAFAAGQPERKYKKALKYSMVGIKAPLVEQFQILKEIGYDGIDMDKPADHAEVHQAQKESGLIVHGVVDYVHWKQPLSHPDPAVREAGVEGLKTALRDSKAYGGTTVLLVVGVVNKDISYADAYKRTQEEIRKVLPLAAELQIKIAFENVWNMFLLSPLEFARYIDDFESPWVGAYFDIGNVVNYGWPEQWIRTLGKRIVKLDIKEYSRKLRDEKGPYAGFAAELGDGDVEWPVVLKALDEIGFTGWGTAEVKGGDRDRLLEVSQRMDRVLALR